MLERELKNRYLEYVKSKALGLRYVIWASPAFKHLRWDIFNIFDFVIVFGSGKVEFIQLTTSPNVAARRKKMLSYMVEHKVNIPNSYLLSYNVNTEVWSSEKVEIENV